MMKTNIWLTVAVAAVLFLSGGTAGFFIGRIPPHRIRLSQMSNQSPEKIKAMMSNRVLHRLKLSDAQQKQIAPAVDRWFEQMNELRRKHAPEFQAAFTEFFDRIAPVLTPEQKPELENIRKEAAARISSRGKFKLPPPPPPPAKE